ncbi:MAG: cyclodeaminase/cyclohydrolase family protein [Candidatus Omnitrophica bacterium]|nr:cyclodeaminase/cyclohydrolase family protein [Candidatus Omnitrophota bacterium]
MYKNTAIKDYLNQLAAKLPVPGGGSSSALCAASAAALVSMVVNFTLGNPRYLKYEKKLRKVLDKSESLRKEFLRLVDLDAVAYESKNIRDAFNVPFMVSRLCFEGIKLCPILIRQGNINLVSDAAIAAVLFEAGFSSACFNIEVNLKSMNDKNLSREVAKELRQKNRMIRKIRAQVEERVGKIIRG